MTLYSEILNLIIKYEIGAVSLREFRENFVLLYRAGLSDIEAAVITKDIEALYGDLVLNEIDEVQFRKDLRVLTLTGPDIPTTNPQESTVTYCFLIKENAPPTEKAVSVDMFPDTSQIRNQEPNVVPC